MIYTSKQEEAIHWKVEIDFISDLEIISEMKLCELGVSRDINNPASVQLVNYSYRKISSEKKEILQSQEFLCPPGYEQPLKPIYNKIAEGDDLSPYLSHQYDRIDYTDSLFNDWHIYHFHLSDQFDEDGKATRSNFLLFAYIKSTKAYLIQIYSHNEKDVFAKTDMLSIIKENWPELIFQYGFEGTPVHTFSDSTIRELRKHNINVITPINHNRGFLPIGGGSSSDGSPTEAITGLLAIQRKLAYCQRMIINNTEKILKSLIEHISEHVNHNLAYELVKVNTLDRTFVIFEKSNSIRMTINEDNLESLLIEPIAD